LQYRAWGALKSLTYGNAKTVALGYDSNLNGCILDDVPVPCEMVTNDSATQCPNNQCKRGNRFFRSFSDGYADYVPSDARYEGHGIARSDSAAAGSLDELAGVVVLAPSQNPAPTPTPTPCPGSIPEDIAKLIESAFTDGLSNPFGTVSQNRFTQEYTDFNGDFEENVIVAARAFSRDILPRNNGNADASGRYRGPADYQGRYNHYLREAAGDRRQLNCIAGRR
jgi:hypothetical protein